MNHETARVRSGPQTESLPFSRLPHQTKLFLDYLADPLSLKTYYPNAVASPMDVREFVPQVLENYATDRDALCDALAETCRASGSGERTFANIELLRRRETVAVVTGQQAGLFTGPLYTIYKALSAVKMAERLNSAGTPAVPVFWIASEDHDLDEVAKTCFNLGGGLTDIEYKPRQFVAGAPVGDVMIDDSIASVIESLDGPDRDAIAASWSPGNSFASAFARDIASLLASFGLIIIDPMSPGVKRLAAPFYGRAIENSDEIVAAIRKRSSQLVADGYHAQVLVDEDYFPLFWHTDDGRRSALRKTSDSTYRSKEDSREFTLDELAALARSEPARLSPGVMLRPAVQDDLLPTACYFGGSAEIAYFAQNAEAYRVLARPVTPVFHRQSFTIVEQKQRRLLGKLGMGVQDIFDGLDPVLTRALERTVSPETAKLFADVEEKVNTELNRLDQALSELDPTLAANLATRRRKIVYHIGALRKKAYAAKLRKEQTVESQVRATFDALLPKGVLQERVLNVHSYVMKYGASIIDQVYAAIDLDDPGHRIVQI